MSKSISKLPIRNDGKFSRKNQSEDIHQLVKQFVPRTYSDLKILDSLTNVTQEDLILYTRLLVKFLEKDYPQALKEVNDKQKYSENNLLIDAVYDIESEMSSHYYNIDFSDWNTGYIHVEEWMTFLGGTIFGFNFNFVEMDISENLKIGIAKVLKKIMEYAGHYKWSANFLNDYYTYEMEYIFDMVQEDDYPGKEKEFLKEIESTAKEVKKIMKKVFKYSNMKFNKTIPFMPVNDQEIHERILRILDFDMNLITKQRESFKHDYDYMADGTLELEYLFMPSIVGHNYFVDHIFEIAVQARVDEFNSSGCEGIMKHHTISTEEITCDVDNEEIYTQFENDLKELCVFIQMDFLEDESNE